MADCMPARDEQIQPKDTVERKEKKHRLVEKAIPNIANAIKTVVSLSQNENFRGKCFNLVKVKDEDEFSRAITKTLWNIATSKLNVKSCDDGDSQIVPGVKDIKAPVDEPKRKATVKQTAQNVALNEVSSGDYFDDLAGELPFYEDLCSQENNPCDQDPDTCGTSFLVSEEQEAKQKSTPVNLRELLCSVEKPERSKPLPLTEIIPDITSPKAKLRCCQGTFASTRKPVCAKDWLQEFSQDLFWMESDERPASETLNCFTEEKVGETVNLGTLQSTFQGDTEGEDGDLFIEYTKKSKTLSDSTTSNNAIKEKSTNNLSADCGLRTHHSNQQDRVSPASDTSSQCITSSDHFDTLAGLSFI